MKLKFVVFIVWMLSFQVFSQDLLTGITYSIAVPAGETKDFISKTSFTGLTLDLRKFVAYNLSVDFLFGWNGFEEGSRGLYYAEINGAQYKLMNSFPMMIATHYYFGEGTEFRPFLGAGIGTYYIYQKVETDLQELESSKWHFGFETDVGMVYLFETIYAFMNVRYHYAFAAGNGIKDISVANSYWAFNIGLAITPLSYF